MKLTNKHNLPGPIFSKIASTMRPNPPRYGLTTLLRPAHMLDFSDPKTILKEHLIEHEIDGVMVRTAIDRLWRDGPSNVLTEFKNTSVWSVIFGKDEWEQQLNLQAAMLDLNGRVADRLEVIAL